MLQSPVMKKSLYISAIMLVTVCISLGVSACNSSAPVVLEETEQVYILDNGIVRAQVAKASGDIVSLQYLELWFYCFLQTGFVHF